MSQNNHEWVRDVRQKSTGKPAAKCTCGEFHLVDNHEQMDVDVSIPKDDIAEVNAIKDENSTVFSEVKSIA